MAALGHNKNSPVTRRSNGKITGGGSLLKKGGWPPVPSCTFPLLAFLLPGILMLWLRGSQGQVGEIYSFFFFFWLMRQDALTSTCRCQKQRRSLFLKLLIAFFHCPLCINSTVALCLVLQLIRPAEGCQSKITG